MVIIIIIIIINDVNIPNFALQRNQPDFQS